MVAGWEVIGDISFLRGRQHIILLERKYTGFEGTDYRVKEDKIFSLAFSNDCLF
ncbi:unnamed protein product [Brassica oleracea var. botrytis]|uniref:Uncharacterized protein n=2 Tax=Brassica TaxID=3705 RepID=A0A3P6EMA3_BRAOL|nr:unnamed protein product [Brassica napus]VDD40918.1 unnamed protein product [Brassica oleracea]